MKGKQFYIFLAFFIASCNAQNRNYKNHEFELSEIIKSHKLNESKISVCIDKSDYKLCVKIDTMVLKEYPVVFGKNPIDDKLRQGDKCTPEGTFRMITKYPHKKWSKFIWIDFPNENSWKKHNSAKKEGKIPKDSKIGGEIGIHGVPKGMDYLINLKYNWTLGCISMKNKDIDEIYPYFSESTVIEIKK
jgi:murein L,D-transpeptidase YafK